ncbi:hypothetical protein LJB42_003930 [Komagataella kurtzmanii]|nr:hypothetical protein LJB42_003930 [Komagataella kurtzmanii]
MFSRIFDTFKLSSTITNEDVILYPSDTIKGILDVDVVNKAKVKRIEGSLKGELFLQYFSVSSNKMETRTVTFLARPLAFNEEDESEKSLNIDEVWYKDSFHQVTFSVKIPDYIILDEGEGSWWSHFGYPKSSEGTICCLPPSINYYGSHEEQYKINYSIDIYLVTDNMVFSRHYHEIKLVIESRLTKRQLNIIKEANSDMDEAQLIEANAKWSSHPRKLIKADEDHMEDEVDHIVSSNLTGSYKYSKYIRQFYDDKFIPSNYKQLVCDVHMKVQLTMSSKHCYIGGPLPRLGIRIKVANPSSDFLIPGTQQSSLLGEFFVKKVTLDLVEKSTILYNRRSLTKRRTLFQNVYYGFKFDLARVGEDYLIPYDQIFGSEDDIILNPNTPLEEQFKKGTSRNQGLRLTNDLEVFQLLQKRHILEFTLILSNLETGGRTRTVYLKSDLIVLRR